MKPGLCLMFLFLAGRLAAVDPAASPTNSPTNSPPQPPKAAVPKSKADLRSIQMEPGFRLELVASAPLIANPVAMAFDEDARLYVLEATDSSADGQIRHGRIRILEDSDGTGLFSASAIYADVVDDPTALICYGGGVFVASAGQIIYFKDTKGNGQADVRREVFRSFAEATNGADGKVIISSLVWGLDNRIHAATGGQGGDIISAASPAQSIILTNGNFAFDPRSQLLTAAIGSGASGMCFDDRGRKFVLSKSGDLQMIMYDARYAARNPLYEMPGALLDLQPSLPPPDQSVPKHFSNPDGLAIYRGNAFPQEYDGDAFMANAENNLVQRDKLRPDGVELIAERAADESGAEFIAAKDHSFQPVQVINAPDGTLYIAARASSSNNNTATNGAQARRGIYRVVPVNFKQPNLLQLSKFTGPQLVNLLRHPNGWVRDTAARLIYERQDPATVIPLIRLLFDPRSPPLARMHALHALDGLQVTAEGRPGRSLLEPHIIRALIDPDDRVREHGVLLAEKFMPINQAVSDRLWEQLVAMTGDPSPQVRYQLAFTLGQTHHEGQAAALTEILRGALNDRWIQAAVFSSLKDGAAEIFVSLLADAKVRGNEPRREILRRLSRMIGAEDRPAEIASALDAIQRIPEAQNAFHFARDLGNSVQSANVSLSELDRAGVLNKLYARAESVAVDMKADDPARVEALELLSTTDTADPALTVGLEEEWPYLRGRVRSQAVTALLSRPWRTTNLLFYLQKGLIPQSDLSPIQVRFLLAYPDRTIRQQAFATFGNSNYSPHQSVLNRYVGALQLSGSAEQGRRIFLMRCAACHQVDSEANSAGLDLRDSLKTNAEALLTEILDPNRNDPPACQATLVETRDGETLMGSIVRRSARSITLRDANGVERVEGRANIVAEAGLGFSMIPEGLEAGLGEQDLANLLAYLTTVTTH